MTKEKIFIDRILELVQAKDRLHYKKVKGNVEELVQTYSDDFYNIVSLLCRFFEERKLPVEKIADDYLKMIDDMRIEGILFKKTKKYSCVNQQEAYLKVYSNADVMGYYMNALLLSQVLWTHHFKMLMFFRGQLQTALLSKVQSVLDIGPGHGFFSYQVFEKLTSINNVDIVDISDGSLEMTKAIIGDGGGKIAYFNRDIFIYESDSKYDLIILGEVLEHLDEPLLILNKLGSLLSENGYLWLTTPTNAPALDHVYLFRSRQEIVDLLDEANLEIVKDFGCFAENVSKEIAAKFDISFLFGAFLRNK